MTTTYTLLNEPAFEPSAELSDTVKQYDTEIETLLNRVAELKTARREVIDRAARSKAALKSGDRVQATYRRKPTDFEISHVSGQWFSFDGQVRIIINYSGCPIKKDGSSGDRQSLYMIRVPAKRKGEGMKG